MVSRRIAWGVVERERRVVRASSGGGAEQAAKYLQQTSFVRRMVLNARVQKGNVAVTVEVLALLPLCQCLRRHRSHETSDDPRLRLCVGVDRGRTARQVPGECGLPSLGTHGQDASSGGTHAGPPHLGMG
jgi:hypothetical protein